MILNVPRRRNSDHRADEGGYALMQSRLNKAYALAHPRRARVSGWASRAHGSGREAYQTGEGAPHRSP